jgi:hypothetical protein
LAGAHADEADGAGRGSCQQLVEAPLHDSKTLSQMTVGIVVIIVPGSVIAKQSGLSLSLGLSSGLYSAAAVRYLVIVVVVNLVLLAAERFWFALVDRNKAKIDHGGTVEDIDTAGKRFSALVLGLAVANLAAVVYFVVVLGAAWWTLLIGLVVAGWAILWLPPRARTVTSSRGEINIQAAPERVSAVVADISATPKWEMSNVSCVLDSYNGTAPRYRVVERMPDGREISGLVELTRVVPGSEVVIRLVGVGRSGDYFTFSPAAAGTHVVYKTLIELPWVVALVGARFMTGPAADRNQKKATDLQALKAYIETA